MRHMSAMGILGSLDAALSSLVVTLPGLLKYLGHYFDLKYTTKNIKSSLNHFFLT